jgi:hypothetical protein
VAGLGTDHGLSGEGEGGYPASQTHPDVASSSGRPSHPEYEETGPADVPNTPDVCYTPTGSLSTRAPHRPGQDRTVYSVAPDGEPGVLKSTT